MRLLLASGDNAVAEAAGGAFALDEVTAVDGLHRLREPAVFALIDRAQPAAVVVVPDWTRDGHDEIRGCWWLARCADLARVPLVLWSTAEVFDPVDRRPRDEFAAPAPMTATGRRAHAAEQLVARTTQQAVIVRTGPLDVGAASLAYLIGAGVDGGGDTEVSPVAAAELGILLRVLAVGRRPGVYHVTGGPMRLEEAAERLGMGTPEAGGGPAGPPLDGLLLDLLGVAQPSPWPSAPPVSHDRLPSDDSLPSTDTR